MLKNFDLNYAIQKSVVYFGNNNSHNISKLKSIETSNTIDSKILILLKKILLNPKLILIIIELLLKKAKVLIYEAFQKKEIN
jgi:hypothetical protein